MLQDQTINVLTALEDFIYKSQQALQIKGKTEQEKAYDEYAIGILEIVKDAIVMIKKEC